MLLWLALVGREVKERRREGDPLFIDFIVTVLRHFCTGHDAVLHGYLLISGETVAPARSLLQAELQQFRELILSALNRSVMIPGQAVSLVDADSPAKPDWLTVSLSFQFEDLRSELLRGVELPREVKAQADEVVEELFAELADELDEWRQDFAERAAQVVTDLLNATASEGYQKKQEVVRRVNQLLDAAGLQVVYTAEGGGQFPARLSCGATGLHSMGRFEFSYLNVDKERKVAKLKAGESLPVLDLLPLPSR